MPRGMNRWFFALGVFMLICGWGAIEFAEQQRAVAGQSSASVSRAVWAIGRQYGLSSGSFRFLPGRVLVAGGAVTMAFGGGLAALAAFSLLEEKRRTQPEPPDHE